jgi:hypothetical protein
MLDPVDHETLHRTAKYFMDSGQAASHEEAMSLLERFGLAVCVGADIAMSVHNQTALLTLVNTAAGPSSAASRLSACRIARA